jgi:hypothetical protein
MGLTLTRRSRRRSQADAPPRASRREADELDELIAYGHEALSARGAAPVSMQLDTALRLAGLHLRRASRVDDGREDLRWAARLARFVAERAAATPPAGVVDLGSRAIAALEACAPRLPISEALELRGAIATTRARVERAELLCATALDDAIAALATAEALLVHAPAGDEHGVVVGRARELLREAVLLARRAGAPDLAAAALELLGRAGADRGQQRENRRASGPGEPRPGPDPQVTAPAV